MGDPITDDRMTAGAYNGGGPPEDARPSEGIPARPLGPGVFADDLMAEAVRKILRFQFDVMLAHEEGSRNGKNIDDLHDMRVATRRMRAAFRLFGSYFQPKAIRQFEKDLRGTGRTLGAVRDLDVFKKKVELYAGSLPEERRHGLNPVLGRWRKDRKRARQELHDYLDSKRYRRFVEKFGEFLYTPGAGVDAVKPGDPAPHQVRHVLTSGVWRLYETIWAYEVVLEGAPVATMHALRIDCKFLRYALEFFQEVLGPGAAGVIADVIAVQDHLGDLQDAVVASQVLNDFMADWHKQAVKAGRSDVEEVKEIQAYLAYRSEEAKSLVAKFPEQWPRLDSVDFRRRLAEALATL